MKSGVFCLQAACPGRLQSQTQASCRAAPAAPRAQPPSARPALGRRTGPAALRAKKASASPAPAVDWEAEAEALRASQTKAAQGSEEDETSKLKQATQTIRRLGREGDAIGVRRRTEPLRRPAGSLGRPRCCCRPRQRRMSLLDGNSHLPPQAVAALADLGKAGIQPDIVAVTTTIVRAPSHDPAPAVRPAAPVPAVPPPLPPGSTRASRARASPAAGGVRGQQRHPKGDARLRRDCRRAPALAQGVASRFRRRHPPSPLRNKK